MPNTSIVSTETQALMKARPSITVSESAKAHFWQLLQQEKKGTQIRLSVTQPGTLLANVGLSFCTPGQEDPSDFPLDLGDFRLLVEKNSLEALEMAQIDLQEENFGAQLSIKAPFLKGEPMDADSPLEDRVKHVLEREINPSLALHRGQVSLVEIKAGGIVILQFGGGCHGCGMANVTLKQGIEKTLMERFPEITEIRDVTDHSTGENPYY